MDRRIRWFVMVLAVLFVMHFLLTSLYSFQKLRLPGTVRSVSTRYTVPFFHQNWKLFAPEVPAYDSQLEYRYSNTGSWSEWNDVSHSLGHGSHSKVEYIEQVLVGSLAWQIANNLYVEGTRARYDLIAQSFDYGRAVFFTQRLHELSWGEPIHDSLQLRVAFRFTPEPGKAYTFQKSYLELPVFSVHEEGGH